MIKVCNGYRGELEKCLPVVLEAGLFIYKFFSNDVYL